MLLLAALLAIPALLSPAPAGAADRALLIGISEYDRPGADLDGPAGDVRRMQDLVATRFGVAPAAIRVLAGRVERPQVLDAFDELVARSGPGDRVVIYYSGHGSYLPDTSGDEGPDGRDEVLVMSEFDSPDGTAGVILDDEIAALLDRLADRRVTLFSDSCHSGTISRALDLGPDPGPNSDPGTGPATPVRAPVAARFLPPRPPGGAASRAAPPSEVALRRDEGLVEPGMTGRDHAVWSAATSSQLAWETMHDGRMGGVFTDALVEALSGPAADANGNGRLSREEVLAHVRARATAFCDTTPECLVAGGFTPMLEVPPAARILGVVEWPDEDDGGAGGGSGGGDGPAAAAGGGAAAPGTDPAPGVDELLDLLGAGGRRDVTLAMRPLDPQDPGPVRAGDRVAFEVTSPVGGELLLFDLRDGGLVHQLYPSTAFAKATTLSAHRRMRIPDAYTRSEFRVPAGRGTLVALVVRDRDVATRLAERNARLQPIPDPRAFFGALMQELNGVWYGDESNRKVRFGMATWPYSL